MFSDNGGPDYRDSLVDSYIYMLQQRDKKIEELLLAMSAIIRSYGGTLVITDEAMLHASLGDTIEVTKDANLRQTVYRLNNHGQDRTD